LDDNQPVKILLFPEADTPPELRLQVLALQSQAWPPGESPSAVAGGPTHDPDLSPLTMLLLAGQQVLCALDVLSTVIVHSGHQFRACGLSTVVTAAAARGRGHGHRLVVAAHEVMAASGSDLSLFTCDRTLRRFYENAGWVALPGTVVVGGTADSPFPSDQPGMDKVALADFFSPRARLHRDSFTHAQIHLYPGEIDKLW
jgi:aminoglycoside 2'-N-acetyltransferase I